MSIKLIATDLDGTFLNAKGNYDKERFSKLLDQLQERQIAFLVATGNSMRRIDMLFEGFLDRMDIIAENGALVSINGQVISRSQISPDLVQECLEFFKGKEQEYSLSLTSDDCAYMLEGSQIPDFEGIAPEQLAAMRAHVKNLRSWQELTGTIYKMNLVTSEANAPLVVAQFNKHFHGKLKAVTSGYGGIDILIEGCNKASGLTQVLDYFAIKPSQVMSFGDSDNDLEMLELSGHSYAMANAATSVKTIANHLAPDHDDSGVLQVIEDYLAA